MTGFGPLFASHADWADTLTHPYQDTEPHKAPPAPLTLQLTSLLTLYSDQTSADAVTRNDLYI